MTWTSWHRRHKPPPAAATHSDPPHPSHNGWAITHAADSPDACPRLPPHPCRATSKGPARPKTRPPPPTRRGRQPAACEHHDPAAPRRQVQEVVQGRRRAPAVRVSGHATPTAKGMKIAERAGKQLRFSLSPQTEPVPPQERGCRHAGPRRWPVPPAPPGELRARWRWGRGACPTPLPNQPLLHPGLHLARGEPARATPTQTHSHAASRRLLRSSMATQQRAPPGAQVAGPNGMWVRSSFRESQVVLGGRCRGRTAGFSA